MKTTKFLAKSLLLLSLVAGGFFVPHAPSAAAAESQDGFTIMTGTLTLMQDKGHIRSQANFHVSGLTPGEPAELVWMTVSGGYKVSGIYSFIGAEYKEQVVPLLQGTADDQGQWSGTFDVPEGFGGDHTLYVRQDGKNVAQNSYFVEPTFKMYPASGPVGTEITIEAEGLGWSTMESNWQLTYDNKITGLLSAVSTSGKAKAKIRAAGPAGQHTLTVWHGYLGIPYLNHQQAPTSYLPVPTFSFDVTDEPPLANNYVEPIPASAAGEGVQMPALVNKPGVQVIMSKDAGIVGEQVTLHAEGLPGYEDVQLVWNTMSGSRVSGNGFAEKQVPLAETKASEDGELDYEFAIPDDLGGVPHRIDLMAGGEVYGQAYLLINPSIVSITPASGPSGTEVTIELNGVGWTEFDNSYYLTYDNAYTGYMCGFNTQGSVKFTMVVTGEPGTHLIDLYPGIYKGQQKLPDVYLAPQLTYEQDHPGTKIPAIRMGFDITKK